MACANATSATELIRQMQTETDIDMGQKVDGVEISVVKHMVRSMLIFRCPDSVAQRELLCFTVPSYCGCAAPYTV
jgi:hypothetical protein